MAKFVLVICTLLLVVQSFGRNADHMSKQRQVALDSMVNCPDSEKIDPAEFTQVMENYKTTREIPEHFGCFFKCTMQQKLPGGIAHMDADGTITVTDNAPADKMGQIQECANNLDSANLCEKSRLFFKDCVKCLA